MLWTRIDERSRLLAVIVLVYAMNSLDRGIVGAVMEQIKGEFLLSDRDLGLLSGLAFSAPYALLSLPVGMLIDRHGRKVRSREHH